jgi:hypothetical protein
LYVSSDLRSSFGTQDDALESLAFGLLFGLLAAPSSVVSKRLQKLLGSFQRTLLGVCNNIFVALISIAVSLSSSNSNLTAASVIGSIIVFMSPGVGFVDFNKWRAKVIKLTYSKS